MSDRAPAAAPAEQPGGVGVFGKRLLLTLIAIIVLLLVKSAANVFLALFAGILLAVFLRTMSNWVAARTPLGERWALLGVVLGLVVLLGVVGGFATARIGQQIPELKEKIPQAAERLQKKAEHLTWGTPAAKVAEQPERYLPSTQSLLQRLGGIFSTTMGAISAVLVVIFLGLCFAIEPKIYMRGVLWCVPLRYRPRWRSLLHELNETLSRWLFAKLLSMAIVGVLMWIGLVALGIPMAFSLAILAALLDFVPNIGPIIAGIPAVLFALTQSNTTALYVLLLYVGVQTLESYFITPFIERKTVKLPPALTATAQLVLGLLVGIPGVIVAAPLTAAGMVIVQRLYVEGALGDRLDHDPLEDAGPPETGTPAPPHLTLQKEQAPPSTPAGRG